MFFCALWSTTFRSLSQNIVSSPLWGCQRCHLTDLFIYQAFYQKNGCSVMSYKSIDRTLLSSLWEICAYYDTRKYKMIEFIFLHWITSRLFFGWHVSKVSNFYHFSIFSFKSCNLFMPSIVGGSSHFVIGPILKCCNRVAMKTVCCLIYTTPSPPDGLLERMTG